jgi:hypothetical protein
MLEFGPMQEANPTMRFMRLSSVRTEQIELARYGKLGASPGPVFWLRISVGPRLLHRQRITANALSAGMSVFYARHRANSGLRSPTGLPRGAESSNPSGPVLQTRRSRCCGLVSDQSWRCKAQTSLTN